MLTALKANIAKSEFFKHLITLMFGSGVAMIIPFLASPIITRLYSPEEFGLTSIFFSITAIGATFVTARYEVIIMLVKTEAEAQNVTVLAAALTVILSLLAVLIVYLIGKDYLFAYFEAEELAPYVGLITISIALAGLNQILTKALNRDKQYRRLTNSKIISSTISTAGNIWFGKLNFGFLGLIYGKTFGALVSSIILSMQYLKSFSLDAISWRTIKTIVYEFKRYPCYNLPSDLVIALSLNVHSIMLLKFFGEELVGLYSFGYTLIILPISIFSASYAQLYFQQISQLEDLKQIYNIYLKSLKLLGILALFLVIVVIAVPPWFITMCFGMKWQLLPQYLKPIGILCAFQLIGSPLSMIYVKLERFRFFLGYSIFSLVMKIAVIYGCFYFQFSNIAVVYCFALANSILYAILALYAVLVMKNKIRHSVAVPSVSSNN